MNPEGIPNGLVALTVPCSPYQEYLDASCMHADHKSRVVEEHDGWSGVLAAVSAGTGVALTSDLYPKRKA